MKKTDLKVLVEDFGQRYSKILSIDLSSGKEEEIFKWFLASILFGAPISENSAIKTFKSFQKYDVLTPRRILETGWEELVRILDEGGYTRYDFKTADKLLLVMQNLTEKYKGSLNRLCDEAADADDLEKRLKNLGKGMGDVTVSIFLRDLRDIWEKADPNPTALVVLAAKNIRIIRNEADAKTALKQLKGFWLKNKINGKSFIDFETALFRVGKDLRRKERSASRTCS
jgi:hypothetical protein